MVTANKRSQDIKDVPTSIAVLGGSALTEQHIDDYDDIARNVPGLNLKTTTGVGGDNIVIRGIGSQVGAATVGLYLDDTPITLLNQSGTAAPRMFDMDRIEVLRGPQGTLYGASSEGGTIIFHSKQPDLNELSADASSDLGWTEHGSINYDEKGIVNIPILPGELAIRAGVEYGDQSGWIDNYANATGAAAAIDPVDAYFEPRGLRQAATNDVRTTLFKLAATYHPSDDLTITPSILYQREKQSDAPNFYFEEALYQQTRETAEYARDTEILPSLKVEKGLGFADVTSVTSYFWRQYTRNSDGTYYDPDVVVPYYIDTATDAAGNPLYTSKQIAAANSKLALLPDNSETAYQTTVVTEELRLTSPVPVPGDLPVKWVAGFYFSNDTERTDHAEPAAGWDNIFESIFGYNPNDAIIPGGVPGAGNINPIAADAVRGANLWSGDSFYTTLSKRGIASYAGFGQIDFDILPNLHGEVGARYQFNDLSYSSVIEGWWGIGSPEHYSSPSRDYALTPKFSLTYDLSDTANVYATASKGYRIGGVNSPIPNGLCAPFFPLVGATAEPPTYGPDKLWSYELGTKSRLLDDTLSIDADVYYIQWNNVQQQILVPVCFFNYVTNVGDAESYGTEITLRYKVRDIPGLSFDATFGAQHATVTATTNSAAAAVGEKLLFTPDWTSSFGISYSFPLGDNLSGFTRADYDWTGRTHGDFKRSAVDYSGKQYGVVNGSIGVDTGDLQVSLYAKNLADDQTIYQHPIVAGIQEAYTAVPLTIGLLVQKHFAPAEAETPYTAPPAPAQAPVATPAPVPEPQRRFQVFFDFDKSEITEAAAGVIAAAAESEKAGHLTQVAVTGHTDTVGTAKYNQALSERRAAAVKKLLVADGVPDGEITAIGVGKTGLLVPTKDGVREPQNRRAEIVMQ